MEKLEFIKSFKNKLNKSFVDSFQRYDLYHKLNIYLNHYNKFQIKAYLRNNLILNLIFIQKFKEFKYYNNHFYLNLNLLPTTFSEYFKSLKIQLYKEAIKNNLYTYALVSNLLDQQALRLAYEQAHNSQSLDMRQGQGIPEQYKLNLLKNQCGVEPRTFGSVSTHQRWESKGGSTHQARSE